MSHELRRCPHCGKRGVYYTCSTFYERMKCRYCKAYKQWRSGDMPHSFDEAAREIVSIAQRATDDSEN